ncbi:hypothetical protein U1Q18_052602 [Sarracenia purpurea var. burkii]
MGSAHGRSTRPKGFFPSTQRALPKLSSRRKTSRTTLLSSPTAFPVSPAALPELSNSSFRALQQLSKSSSQALSSNEDVSSRQPTEDPHLPSLLANKGSEPVTHGSHIPSRGLSSPKELYLKAPLCLRAGPETSSLVRTDQSREVCWLSTDGNLQAYVPLDGVLRMTLIPEGRYIIEFSSL